MNYQLFIHILQQELLNALSPDITPRLQRYIKNNDEGQEYISFVPSSHSAVSNIYPVVSLKLCYEQYMQGKDIPAIISDIIRLLKHIKTAPGIHPEQFTDFEQIKDGLCLKLVNRKNNGPLLEDTPFISYYDLALVCIYFHHDSDTDIISSVLIQKQHLTLWHITEKKLFEQAIRNSPRLMPPLIRPMHEMLQELSALQGKLFPFKNIYVLTNEYRYFGAVCVTFPDILAHFAEEIQSDLILVPASIHEIIILPGDGYVPENLNDTINSVNNTSLEIQDRLSDHYYYYDRVRKLIQY